MALLLRRSLRPEDGFFKLSLGQKLFKPGVFFLQLSEKLGLFCLHAAVELAPAVVSGLGDFQDTQTSETVLPWALS